MDRLPTLLIVADSEHSGKASKLPLLKDDALQQYDGLNAALQRGMQTGLPLTLVAPKDMARRAKHILPGNAIAEIPDEIYIHGEPRDIFSRSIALGVATWPNAYGWIILPTTTPTLAPETLIGIAKALAHQSIVYTQGDQHHATPIGFGPELFSELVRIKSQREFDRLINRYPSLVLDSNRLKPWSGTEPHTAQYPKEGALRQEPPSNTRI